MAHRSGGLYRLLELPSFYERFQRLLGARAARTRLISEFLRPWPGARLLDVGCGTGSLLDDLPPSIDYTGFDINPRYIDAARQRYGEGRTFFVGTAGQEPEALREQRFDIVVARALLHHLDDADAGRLAAFARRVLRPGGIFFSSDPVFYDGQPWFSKLLARLDRGGGVRTPDAYRRLLAPDFAEIDTTLVTDMLRIPYAHFIMRARA